MSPLLGCRHQHQNQHININLSISISITSVSTSAPANQCKPQCNGSNFEKHSPSPSNPKNPYCNKQSIQKRTRHKGIKAQIRIQRKTIGQGEILASKNNVISRNYQFYKWLQVHVQNMYNLCMKWQVNQSPLNTRAGPQYASGWLRGAGCHCHQTLHSWSRSKWSSQESL